MTKEQTLGIVRHVLAAAGVWLVATGQLDEAAMQEAAGAVLTLAAVVWSLWEKRAAAK